LLAWGAAWGLFLGLRAAGSPVLLALLGGTLLGVLGSVWGGSWWRRGLIGLGFPLSLALSGVLAVPAWVWLLPLALLLLVYPLNAWRDAPLFPTPGGALDDLPEVAPLPPGARVLDAGCGLGQGLQALRRAYPLAELHGLEWSRSLRLLCAWRCPWAKVTQGDIWRADWSGYQLVYLFQRPESMARALAKARAELRPGAWLVSLEFPVGGESPSGRLDGVQGRPVWLYQMG
jgi:SAM-dependent methyltransferase